MTAVGIVGLGAMGGAIAGALLRKGHDPLGYDLDASAGARFAAEGGRPTTDVGDVLDADLVMLVLRDEAQIESLLFPPAGPPRKLRSGTVLWIASTVSPGYVARLGQRLARAGVHVLDGPVSGGVARARAGTLTLILSGDDVAFDAAAAVTPALAEKVFRVGNTPGPASVVKAANQILTAANIALTAEALGFAIRGGVDPRLLVEIINVSAGASRMFADRAPRMLDGDFAPHATLGIFLKDLAIALEAARQTGAGIPMAVAAAKVFGQAAEAFGAETGDPALFRLYGKGRES